MDRARESTLARHVSAAVQGEYVELDELWWQAGWTPSDPGQFARRVRDQLLNVRWVVDGNYLNEVGVAEVWQAAEMVVWLDLPRRVAFRSTVQRSARRALTRQQLWNGNRERLSVLTPRSLRRLWRSWPGYGGRIRTRLQDPALNQLRVVRLRSPRHVRSFLLTLGTS